MKSLQGQFLVASPYLPDENFYQSVILIIHHDEQGAFGLLLNRPTSNKVSEIWSAITDEPCSLEQEINLGGPVAGPLLALHTYASYSESQVIPGVHVASQKETLREVLRRKEGDFLLFSGYSGWGGGQLENEMKVGGWLTAPASAQDVFSDQEDLWRRVSQKIGDAIIAPSIKTRQIPSDPSLN